MHTGLLVMCNKLTKRFPQTNAPPINKSMYPIRSGVLSALMSPYPTVVRVIVTRYMETT